MDKVKKQFLRAYILSSNTLEWEDKKNHYKYMKAVYERRM